jgi:hypothetical protein
MSTLLPKNVANMIERRLCGDISRKQLADWAWDAHWKDETGERPYDAAHIKVLSEVISALAHSDTEGFDLSTNELQKLWQQLISYSSD